MKSNHIIIVGASFAGIKTAWELRHRLGPKHKITLINNQPATIFRASFPHVIFEDVPLANLTLDLENSFAKSGIKFVVDRLAKIDQENNLITGRDKKYSYDYLVLATGARHAYELLPGSDRYAHSICDPARIMKTKTALLKFRQGIFYTGVSANYTPCDGPPFEVVMNLDYRLRQLGVRDQAELHFVTDKEHLLPPGGPAVWQKLEALLTKHDIQFHLNTELEKLDAKRLHFSNGQKPAYDLCVLIPPYRGVTALADSGLVDERGFVTVNLSTMRATEAQHYNIYAVGDCAATPGPKQGHLALMQAAVAAEHLAWRINGTGAVRAYLPEFKCVLDLGGQRGLYLYSQWMSDGDKVEIKTGRAPYQSKIAFERQFFAKGGDIGELHHQIMK